MSDQKTIYRYPVSINDRVQIALHPAAEILSVAPSRLGDGVSQIDVWATSYDGPIRTRELVIVGTGNPVPAEPLRFVGTCVMPSGLVWHVFEGVNRG